MMASLDLPTNSSSSSTPHSSIAASPPPHLELFQIIEGNHFRAARLPLIPGLICLIGGSGAGKTTLLQSIRHSLGVVASDPLAAQNEAQVLGTLGTGSLATSVCTKHGARLTSARRGNEPPRVTVTDSGAHANVSLDGDLFKIRMYAQNEIQALSTSPLRQLKLLDEFAPTELRALEDRIQQVDRRIEANAAQGTRLETEIEDIGSKTSELPAIVAALQALTEAAGPNADEARRAHEAKVLRGREQAMLRSLRDELRAVLTSTDAYEVDARRRLGTPLSPTLAASTNRSALEHAHAAASDALRTIQDAVTRVRSALASAESAATTAGDMLGAAHSAQDASYEAMSRQHDADRGRVAERERLQRRFLELEALEKKLAERRAEHASRETEAQGLREDRARLIQTKLAVRQRAAADITAAQEGRLEVTVIGGADSSAYLALLLELVKGANIRVELLQEIARNVAPDDLAALVRANDTAPIQAVDDAKTNKAERAQKVINALRASGQVARLDTVRLRDVPVIKLKVDGTPRPTTELSSGQRCTAVLLIILIQSDAPLIIDQPEDQLDNAFIYDVLVPALKIAKKSRQIIFATHNPNIIVLSESDRVFVVESANSVGRIVEFGTVDEVRGSIERLVEGGREAFMRRSERYGH